MSKSIQERSSATLFRLAPGHVLSPEAHDWLNRHVDYMKNPAQAGYIRLLRPAGPIVTSKSTDGGMSTQEPRTVLVDERSETDIDWARQPINPCEFFAAGGALQPVQHSNIEARRSTLAVLIPAWNEEKSIGLTLESLMRQTRPVDHVFVIANNCKDETARVAREWAARYTNITVFDLDKENNGIEGKVDAMGFGFLEAMFTGYDFIVGTDSDVICDPRMVEFLEDDIINFDDTAAIRARYGMRHKPGLNFWQNLLVDLQAMEFADTEAKDQNRRGMTAIVGGQGSIFRTEALLEVMEKLRRPTGPWNRNSAVEDAELTQVLKDLGWKTRVSRRARAWVDPMTTGRALEKQRFKWQGGHLLELWQRLTDDFRNLWRDRERWAVQFNLAVNTITRMMFFALLLASVSQHRWVFRPIWLTPIVATVALSYLTALKTPNRTSRMLWMSLVFVFSELYLWRAIAVFVLSVLQVICKFEINFWNNQAAAENSKKSIPVVTWFTVGALFTVPALVLTVVVSLVSSSACDHILYRGWLTLSIITAVTTAWVILRGLGRVFVWRRIEP